MRRKVGADRDRSAARGPNSARERHDITTDDNSASIASTDTAAAKCPRVVNGSLTGSKNNSIGPVLLRTLVLRGEARGRHRSPQSE